MLVTTTTDQYDVRSFEVTGRLHWYESIYIPSYRGNIDTFEWSQNWNQGGNKHRTDQLLRHWRMHAPECSPDVCFEEISRIAGSKVRG